MADSGESPEAPQPREMIDLEVSGITNTRMIGSIYITTMLVIKLNWKMRNKNIKSNSKQFKRFETKKKFPQWNVIHSRLIDWHLTVKLHWDKNNNKNAKKLIYSIEYVFFYCFCCLLILYSIQKKKHIWLTIDTISFIIFLFSSLFLSLVVCIFHLMWLCFLTPFVVAIGNIWKTGKWIARSQSECRSIEAKLFGAHRIAAYSAQNTGVLRWGKSTHKSNSKRNKINE